MRSRAGFRGRDRGGRAAGWVAAAVIVAGAAASLWLNLPGHLSYDSVVQLSEGREGVYGLNGHPPVMSWLLGIADTIRPGAAVFVVFDVALITGALLAFIGLGKRPGWLAVILAAAFAAIPQLLIYPAIVWKDVLFAGAAIAGFACLSHMAAGWARPATRGALLAAGALLLTLAAMTRQNGIVILPFAALAVGWTAARAPGRSRPGANARRAAAYGLGFLCATLMIMAAGSFALSPPQRTMSNVRGQVLGVQAYDLVSALVIAPDTPLPVLKAQAPWIEHILRTDGVAEYSPIRADTLGPALGKASAHGDIAGPIIAQWKAMFLRDPWLYARVRAKAFQWVLMTPSADDCVLIYTGVDGGADEMADLGLARRKSARDDALDEYAMNFAGTPVYAHAAYGFVGLGLLAWFLIRRRPADIPAAAMLAGAMTFAASFAVISIACDYRYLYALDLAVIAASLYAAAAWRGGPAGGGLTGGNDPRDRGWGPGPGRRWRRP